MCFERALGKPRQGGRGRGGGCCRPRLDRRGGLPGLCHAAGRRTRPAESWSGLCRLRRRAASQRARSTPAMIQLKRVYEKPSRRDGLRLLVDRLCPRGLTKERAAVSLWLKDVAPSTERRQWFGHDPAKWKRFSVRYRKELREKKDALKLLRKKSKEHTVTLVYGARDEEHNEALVLKGILEG